MNIGILTYHFGTNFGGQLQCYALNKVLQSMGHSTVVINYVPQNIHYNVMNDLKANLKMLSQNRNFTTLMAAVNSLFYSRKQRENFSKFQKKYLNIGPLCTLQNFTKLYPELDAVIVGSDQVWAPAHHRSGAYFFNFSPEFKGLKIAYSPCCAINKVSDKNRNQLSDLLRKFNSVSVRNVETQNFVYNLIQQEVPIVADPTFLYPFKEFTSSKVPVGQKYILVYVLGKEIDGGHCNIIQKIRKKIGDLPVYVIALSNGKPKYYSWATKIFWDLDPVDWVAFIKSASFIYTDSFHGTVFALKFHIPFIAYYKELSRASRFIDLKERFQLKNITNHSDYISDDSVLEIQPNYKLIDKTILDLQEVSFNFLNKSLL